MNDQGSFPFMPGRRRRMSSPRTTFNKKRAEEAKLHGMDAATAHRRKLLEVARQAMVQLALSREDHEVDADDISIWLLAHGRHPSELGPATPSVFRTGEWEWTGRWRKSERESNHRSDLRIWKLR